MNLLEMKEALQAQVLTDELDESVDITLAYATDLMSDALAFASDNCVLITGLVNSQTVRTAEMKDFPCVIYTRGKMPEGEIIALANTFGLCVMRTELSTFDTCGILYGKGIIGPNNHG
ncbi:DRTGG domain-containing protein [Eubacterium oxidoreducens]|uniref:DRTGG domain-containing protein n=1 Tax=Eubacterium oxidoreducens TaxID=1732 RepID=A0A1G6BVD4_EUBOX|nr:DRTGG domain-containing protein [Eubacterium oxidoreducens]SDB24552.1 DRTGG domain-containing protein [Eubacterium oxidoreducens]